MKCAEAMAFGVVRTGAVVLSNCGTIRSVNAMKAI
jgi:hypothetical protein